MDEDPKATSADTPIEAAAHATQKEPPTTAGDIAAVTVASASSSNDGPETMHVSNQVEVMESVKKGAAHGRSPPVSPPTGTTKKQRTSNDAGNQSMNSAEQSFLLTSSDSGANPKKNSFEGKAHKSPNLDQMVTEESDGQHSDKAESGQESDGKQELQDSDKQESGRDSDKQGLDEEDSDETNIEEGEEEEVPKERAMPARGVPLNLEDNDGDDEENSGSDREADSNLIEMLARAAAAKGISLDWLVQQAREEEDDTPVEYPFGTLPSSLSGVADFIRSEKCRRILVLAGAGMSVASGIPDFRSPGGLYSTLQANSLSASPEQQAAIRSDPSFALDQHLFLENPLPLLEIKRDFILGSHDQRWKATLAHRFVELLHAKTGKLVRLYTQNIDGLEDQCTLLPEDKVIHVHGTMDRAECARCNTRANFPDFCQQVRTQIKDITGRDSTAPSVSTPIACTACGAHAVKPSIVLFRSSLPPDFFENVGPDVSDVDLLIVLGTSLKVAPANSLVWRVPRSAMRVLINREIVGEHLGMSFAFNSNNDREHGRDFFAGGDCDVVVLDLIQKLGWLPDLEPLLAEQKLPQSSANILLERLAQIHVNGGRKGIAVSAPSALPLGGLKK